MIKQRLATLEARSRARIEQAKAIEREHALRLETRRAGAEQSPIYSRGFRFHAEGAETALVGETPVDISPSLPTREVAWKLRPGSYKVELTMARPATLQAQGPDGPLMSNRSVGRSAVLEFSEGNLVLQSSEPITWLRVSRFTEHAEGELTLGPFHAHGIVEANAIAHGHFQVDIAQDYLTPVTLRGEALHVDQPIRERGQRVAPVLADGLPWSAAHLIEDVDDPVFVPDVAAGTVLTSREIVDIEDTAARYWDGLGEWAHLTGRNVPGFGPPGHWTYVWGAATGPIDQSIDFRTGHPTDPAQSGYHLIRSEFPDDVDIEGKYMHSLSGISDQILHPDRYLTAQAMEYASAVILRVKGRGQLRALDLLQRRRAPFPGHGHTHERRIELAELSTGGPGTTTATTQHTPQKLYRA